MGIFTALQTAFASTIANATIHLTTASAIMALKRLTTSASRFATTTFTAPQTAFASTIANATTHLITASVSMVLKRLATSVGRSATSSTAPQTRSRDTTTV